MSKAENESTIDSSKILRAILLILLDKNVPETERTKPEVLLYRAGISIKEIAELFDKKEDAIRKSISRSKSAG